MNIQKNEPHDIGIHDKCITMCVGVFLYIKTWMNVVFFVHKTKFYWLIWHVETQMIIIFVIFVQCLVISKEMS
jgi:hypothetical protein